MSGVLQNTKYQNAIDACNSCFEACEYCSTECCLRGEDVKKMVRCILLCRALTYAVYVLNLCQESANLVSCYYRNYLSVDVSKRKPIHYHIIN